MRCSARCVFYSFSTASVYCETPVVCGNGLCGLIVSASRSNKNVCLVALQTVALNSIVSASDQIYAYGMTPANSQSELLRLTHRLLAVRRTIAVSLCCTHCVTELLVSNQGNKVSGRLPLLTTLGIKALILKDCLDS